MSTDFLETLQQLRDGTFDFAAARDLQAKMRALEAQKATLGAEDVKQRQAKDWRAYVTRQKSQRQSFARLRHWRESLGTTDQRPGKQRTKIAPERDNRYFHYYRDSGNW